jgi:hypothetical protein
MKFIITGAAGVGKTHKIEEALKIFPIDGSIVYLDGSRGTMKTPEGFIKEKGERNFDIEEGKNIGLVEIGVVFDLPKKRVFGDVVDDLAYVFNQIHSCLIGCVEKCDHKPQLV